MPMPSPDAYALIMDAAYQGASVADARARLLALLAPARPQPGRNAPQGVCPAD